MSLPTATLEEYVDDILAWASEIAEMWTGTLHEKYIDLQQAQLIKAMERKDYEKAEELMKDLAQALHYAEEEYE
jgi:hypothetical protein